MNAALSSILAASKRSSAYLYNIIGAGESSIYEWVRESDGWKKSSGWDQQVSLSLEDDQHQLAAPAATPLL
jgi:hypothetical protein